MMPFAVDLLQFHLEQKQLFSWGLKDDEVIEAANKAGISMVQELVTSGNGFFNKPENKGRIKILKVQFHSITFS